MSRTCTKSNISWEFPIWCAKKNKVFKTQFIFVFHGPASQRAWAHGPGPDPGPMGQGHGPGPGPMDQGRTWAGPMDQGRTRAQWARAMGPWTGPSFRRPRRRPTLRGARGGAEPPRMKKIQTFFWLSKQSRALPGAVSRQHPQGNALILIKHRQT